MAETESEVIGALTTCVLPGFEQAHPRRASSQSAMIDRLKATRKSSGAWIILVQEDHGDDPAIALYTTRDPWGRDAFRTLPSQTDLTQRSQSF